MGKTYRACWMMFRPEGVDVLYIWDEKFPLLFHVAPHEGKNEDWYWSGKGNSPDVTPEQANALDRAAYNNRKRVFTVPGKDRRFQVVSRGTYEYTNNS